ncbi:type II secretion system protein GspH [Pseudomonas kairouanensis]|uniref:Type II secretion system protein H n=1 Tax=Pseudomonas kairouanensis TaxID=2293832 RepID=A0A4Z0ATY4_9PSED|nr:type II secretion system minor pseudopilin GspH [Pseudomonas kairouanensis]TFY89853.1 type II secretion system protein GspH [Pseudomonas kairouanensis]
MRRQSRGFTLLELMVVIALVGIVLGAVSLATGNSPARQARQEAGLMLQLLQQLREQAVIEGREYGVRLQPGEYQVFRLEPQGWRPSGAAHRVAQGVQMHLQLEGLRVGLDRPGPQLLALSSDEVSAFVLSFTFAEQVLTRIVSDGIGETWIES